MLADIGIDIERAKNHLIANEIIGLPTETVYGLAGNGLKAEVVAKIFAIKNRPFLGTKIVRGPGQKAFTKSFSGAGTSVAREVNWE